MSLNNLKNKVKRRPARKKPISRLWKPSANVPTRIRLVAGEHTHPDGTVEPIGFYVSHYSPTTRQFTNCSSKWVPSETDEYGWDRHGKCLACYAKETGQLPQLSTSRKYPVTVAICANFHLDPVGYDGKPLPFGTDGKQIRRKVMCTQKGCEGCAKGLDVEWGRKLIWEMPETHLGQLMATQETLSKCCASCGAEPNEDTGKGGLTPLSVMCAECGGPLPLESAEYGDANVEITCAACGQSSVPAVLWQCSECDTPKKPTLFDIDFTVQRSADGMNLQILKAKVKAPDPRLVQNSDYFLTPLELDAYYKGDSLATQAAKLQIENPWDSGPAPFKDYSN